MSLVLLISSSCGTVTWNKCKNLKLWPVLLTAERKSMVAAATEYFLLSMVGQSNKIKNWHSHCWKFHWPAHTNRSIFYETQSIHTIEASRKTDFCMSHLVAERTPSTPCNVLSFAAVWHQTSALKLQKSIGGGGGIQNLYMPFNRLHLQWCRTVYKTRDGAKYWSMFLNKLT